MNTSVRCVVIAVLCPMLAVVMLSPGEAQPGPAGLGEAKPQVVPDCAALAIVKEANKFIREPLSKPPRSVFRQVEIPPARARANALMIALVAQNRMGAPGADTRRFVALRDAALQLATELRKNPRSLNEVRRLVDVMNRFPDILVDRDASLALVRLKDTFNHDDIGGLFGSCSADKSQRIERELFWLARQKTPITAEQADKLELVSYKVALIGEMLRELDDFVPAKRQDERPEWVRQASNVHQNAWQLAATARGGNSAEMRRGLGKLTEACNSCHAQFRECGE